MADRVAELETLLAEGLGLCVRARKLDDAVVTAPMGNGVMPRSGTMSLWVLDQYETDLADWEARARKALS